MRFGDHRITSLIFADDVVLLAPSSLDLQHALGRFAAECEAAGMRVSTSKSEAMVLDRKKVACTLQVGGKVLPQVEEFKYLRVLFTSEGRMDREIDRRIGAAAAVMRSMYRSVVVKKELSRKAKLSIYQSIYVPTLTYGHELWVMTERVRSRIQAAEMSFLRRVVGRSLRDRVRSSVTREELGVEPLLLHIERGQLRWLGHLFRMPPGRLPGEVFRACPTGKRPQERPRTRWRDYVSWLAWERLEVPPEELEEVSGEREVWASLLRLLPPQIDPQRKDEKDGMKVLSPVELDTLCTCAETFSRTGPRRSVCVHGAESSGLVSEAEGCVDVVLNESCLTLSFTHTVQCWSLHRNGRELVWSGELNTTEKTGNALPLPLVPGGYIASKLPFFRPLPTQLQAASLALGTEHAVLLTASGTVYTWGHGSHGQLGHGTLVSEDEPRAVEALWGVPMKYVAAGGWHSACIGVGGDLYVWGWNESGQIGLPSKGLREESQKDKERIEKDHLNGNKKENEDTSDVFISIQAFPALVDVSEASEIKKVSCGSRHTAAITSTGDLYTWGWGLYGQLGHGSRCSSDEPQIVAFFSSGKMSVEDVICGLWNTFVAAV
ncbi:hypothetical protein QTP86_014701, partial [Hemibagrus guttatus]